MKFKYIFISIALLFTNVSFAQFKVGVEAGPVFSTFRECENNADSKVGFKLGILGDYTFSKILRVGTGISYAQKRVMFANMPKSSHPNIDKLDARARYLEIPVTVGVIAKVTDNINVVPKAGVYTNIGLNSSYADATNKDGSITRIEIFRNLRNGEIRNNYFEKYDFGVILGIDFNFYERFAISASYNKGFNTMYEMYIPDPNSKTLNITFAYYFFRK